MCAQANAKALDWEQATKYYQKAYETSKNLNGEFAFNTA